ncbi:hypothetical protein [Streptomyces antibioticus]|uniref:hypothetical protein n=1 Tax=Streptomyces antibioticus TaxID=1890 RepID=UPI0036CA648B
MPRSSAEETDIAITPPKTWTADVPAVANPLRYSLDPTTVLRTTLMLLNLNQTNSFDFLGCARPEPDPAHRHHNEHCENGVEHVSEEATSGGEHDHAARLLERTTTGATATAPRSDGP